MIAEGKRHREIEEYFALTGERPVHHLRKQERRREKQLEAAFAPSARAIHAGMGSYQSRIFKMNDFVWETGYCGLFCDPQKGCEGKGKICSHLPSPGRISSICHVQIL